MTCSRSGGEKTREREEGGGSCSCKRVDAGKACAIRASAETSGRGLNRIGSDWKKRGKVIY